ncbi:putative RNA polymerase sigma-70 factor, region 4 [Rhodococcus phage E3]|uniref:putative RNA polymerase sigma-70 factor, region 4 n=1 Tax=Rhodococcus phage E3 TaxID=1007869 RepID=UPI0002C6DC69|nr:putative RNA polymerase sigma-70 factor, region 4 [Rhodococcus phage E3]AEQ21077.1 putative RNA polymerase sigma-70 factor, region 4 [Rhodococcus phage E3]
MPRQLPADPVKRRVALWKRMFSQYQHWGSLVESDQVYFLTIEGEEIYYYDVMVGLCTLPPRQKEAFDLHVLQGYSEQAAASIMFPNSKWSTPVQQYSNIALSKMIEAYDNFQKGTKPVPYEPRGSKPKTQDVVPEAVADH